MAYSKTGPFTNGSAPGISALFLNNVENELVALNSAATDSNISSDGTGLLSLPGIAVNMSPVVVNGSTSGNMTLYQPFRGAHFKVALIYFNSFRNNGGHTQGIVLPTAFADRSKMICGDLPSTGVSFQKSGVSNSVAVFNTIASAGGGVNNITVVNSNSIGEILGGWDTMIVPTGGSQNISGVMLIVGF